MTFHTFEASACLTGKQFSIINERLKEYGSHYYKDNKVRDRKIFSGLYKRGILIYFFKRDTDATRFVYHLVYRINHARMTNEKDYLNLFHSNDAHKIFDTANEILLSVTSWLPTLNECTLTRFDFCSNLICSKSEMVPELIRLLNQSYIRNDYARKTVWDARAGREVIPKEEATFSKCNYVEISFYNKIRQLKSENLEIDWDPNILRCEIRCRHEYIKALKRKFGIRDIVEFYDNLAEIGEYVCCSQFKNLHLANSFFSLDEIKKRIENANLKNKTKKKLLRFANNSARHKGIENGIIAELETDTFKILSKFSDLNMCAMPLPHRSSIPSGINILDLCLKFADSKSIADSCERIPMV